LKKVRIVLTLPNGIKEENTIAFQCINNLKDTLEYQFEYYPVIGASVGKNRNFGISEGNHLKRQTSFNFDYILFIDYDIEFTQNDVLSLLSHNKFIVSGVYQLKEDRDKSVCGYWGVTSGVLGKYIDWNDSGLVKGVDWCGGGFLLIDKWVLKNMNYPFFTHQLIEYQDYCLETSEDLGFSMNIKKFGFSIWIDCDCKVKHV